MGEKNKKIKVLVAACFPPPIFGVSVMMDLISKMKFEDIEIDRFNLSFNKKSEEIEVFKIRKIFILINLIAKFIILLKKNKYDIVLIAHSFRLSAFLKDSLFVLISKHYGCKVILNARGQKFDVNFYNKQNKFIRKYVDMIFLKIDGIVTVGKKLLKEYEKLYYSKNKYYVFDYVHNMFSNLETEVKEDFDNDKFNILYLSSLTKSKGIFDLLRVAKIFKISGYKNIVFNVCGKFMEKYPEEEKEIKNYILKNELEDIVILKGWVEGEDKLKMLRLSQMFFFPSLNDSFGLVNLEAMAYGLPIVSTKVGAIPEYIEDGKNGFLYEINDVESAANLIIKLYKDKNLREYIAQNNIIKFNKDFTYGSYKEKWHEIFLGVYQSKKNI